MGAMRSVAGVLMGKDRHRFVVVDDDRIVATVLVRGDRVYCHKCVRQEGVGGSKSLLVTPDRTTTDHSIFTVLAVGDKVAMPEMEPLVQVSTPEHGFYVRSPYNDDEYWMPTDELQIMFSKEGAVNE
jgi:hypothetical protein